MAQPKHEPRSTKKEEKTKASEKKRQSDLKERVRKQSSTLKQQSTQLKRGADREKAADRMIEEQREEILHVTRVGKLAEFVSSLAHEISQPLSAILSYAQAAQRMYDGREPQLQEILKSIIEDNHRATEVIRRMRLLLKKSKPAFKTIKINDLIRDTAVLIRSHVIVRNKDITFDLDKTTSVTVRGDRIQLQQVLLNLISNSLEAMEKDNDGDEVRIRTSRKNSDTIMIEVIDTGCGVPKENMKKLFSNFFTNKPDGLGMGLSISRSIVEKHDGRLNFKNNPDRGATFYFTLPVTKKITKKNAKEKK